MMIARITLLRISSYDSIWAVDLSPPRNAYFELLAHPAKRIPYRDTDDSAIVNSTPSDRSASARP